MAQEIIRVCFKEGKTGSAPPKAYAIVGLSSVNRGGEKIQDPERQDKNRLLRVLGHIPVSSVYSDGE